MLNQTHPAVSQICNLILLPPTLMIFDPNSTPIVWDDPSLTEIKYLQKVLK